ncbi:DUF1428 domain-containing protein [Aestuariivirga sp.]|uniref:DUF1428 domain-containing protein n=1 Tax=Aestuariivirga sp. TaxID=2650926 RepID=UPI0039E2F4D9
MAYVDGVVIAVKTSGRKEYEAFSRKMSAVFKDHGALRAVDCWGADVPDGKLTSFPMAVKKEPDETVVLSWVEWPSRDARDKAWEKIRKDPGMQPGGNPMPFDGKRMIYGGFDVIVDE